MYRRPQTPGAIVEPARRPTKTGSLTPDVAGLRFRRLMGLFASGVTVITAADGDRVHGMTANGFMSVSLDPQLVLISVAATSRMHSILEQGEHYGVSVLAENQRELSAHFAGRPGDSVPEFVWSQAVPFIPGALLHVGTEIVDRHPAGDHTLFIGSVVHLSESVGRPLLFHGGRYDQLTAIAEPHLLDALGRSVSSFSPRNQSERK